MAGLGLILAASSIAWIVIIRSLIAMGTILGWPPPFDVPFCVAVVVLLLIYAIVAGQISALRRAAYSPYGGFHPRWIAAWDGIAGPVIVVALARFAYHHLPALHDFGDQVGQTWRQATESV